MSIKTWKTEFFSKHGTMSTFPEKPKRLDKRTVRRAIEHSVLKWEGLTEANLKKHGMHASFGGIVDDKSGFYLDIDGGSCALCRVFSGRDRYLTGNWNADHCGGCPLRDALGGKQCDWEGQPFLEWTENHNPAPMIRALRRTLERFDEGKK